MAASTRLLRAGLRDEYLQDAKSNLELAFDNGRFETTNPEVALQSQLFDSVRVEARFNSLQEYR